jgi:hypothetical protein
MDEKREAAVNPPAKIAEGIRWASGGPGAPPTAAPGAEEEATEAVSPCGGTAEASRSTPCPKCGSLHCFPVPAPDAGNVAPAQAVEHLPPIKLEARDNLTEQPCQVIPALDAGNVAPGGAYSAKGDPSAPTPEPPHVGSSAKRPYSPPVLTEMTRLYYDDVGDMRCPECGASFEFINWNSEQEVDTPSFCPVCGRKNVNLPADEVKKTLPIGNSPLPEGGLPTAADLDHVAEEKRTAGEP